MIKWLAERLYQRCVHCDEVHWKWICYPCHEEASIALIDALQLQLNVVVLNAGNPELIAKLAVMDGDEVIGVVIPDTLKVIDDLGLIIPKSYREKLDG
jgi:hypothetical protein